MDKHTEIVEFLDIYREMDKDGRKKMVTAASRLLKIQKVIENIFISTESKNKALIGYLVTVPLLLVIACVIWFFLISPALLIYSDTPLIMIRIIITALIGVLFISAGIFRFILNKLTLIWLFLAIAAGIGCIDPRVLTDIIGFAIITLIVIVQFIQMKRAKTATAIH